MVVVVLLHETQLGTSNVTVCVPSRLNKFECMQVSWWVGRWWGSQIRGNNILGDLLSAALA